MKLNVEIDDALLKRAQELSGINDISVVITKALELFVTIENQKKILDLRGKIELDDVAFE